jgi:hypothetical protein
MNAYYPSVRVFVRTEVRKTRNSKRTALRSFEQKSRKHRLSATITFISFALLSKFLMNCVKRFVRETAE